jgi:enamine deaminase RidA (YjgF/YER057c/UK114 family)
VTAQVLPRHGLVHLPMGLTWSMPVPVACSLAVSVGGLAATCGQCPLDGQGRVLFPGDPAAQAQMVAQVGAGALGHLPRPHHAAMVVVYHTAADAATVLAPLAAAFPGAVLALVRLPHFYYPGMAIELDIHATTAAPQVTRHATGDTTRTHVAGGPIEWVHLSAPSMADLSAALAPLDPARVLSAHWFAADAPPAAFDPVPAARVIPPDGTGATAILALAPGPVNAGHTPGGAVLRQGGGFAWIAAQGGGPDLAAAAHGAMDALDLPGLPGLTPLKATTHYVGGPGPDDLHANLAVRHARFPMPGPASTGVPVRALAGAMLAVDMLCAVDSVV